jgi:hypothetical protein
MVRRGEGHQWLTSRAPQFRGTLGDAYHVEREIGGEWDGRQLASAAHEHVPGAA